MTAYAVFIALVAIAVLAFSAATAPVAATTVFRVDHVADGDTVDLTNGAKIRLVQIDIPEVLSLPVLRQTGVGDTTKHLLPPRTRPPAHD